MPHYLGFDYGTGSTGVAVGQDITATAQPLTTLRFRNGKVDPELLDKLFADWKPEACVIGLPRNMDGTETKLAPKVRQFGWWLRKQYKVEVYLVDERNTSTSAREVVFAKKGFKGLDKHKVDQVAAAIILQAWFDGDEYEVVGDEFPKPPKEPKPAK